MNGIAVVVARHGTKWAGKTTGKLTIRDTNRMNGAIEAEKKEQPNDRKEEAETVKREKEMEKDYNTAEEALRERERIRIQGNKRFEEMQKKREKEGRRERR